MNSKQYPDTIVAIATPPGIGAIGLIRMSGDMTFSIMDALFKGKKISKCPSHTIHYGHIIRPERPDELIDEVLVAVFRNPRSYTGEDTVEISCHGAPIILSQILEACIASGARLARAGEFTQRAFLNGKLDLAQAEAVADLIAADSRAAQAAALSQLRGGFSSDLNRLRDRLIHFAAMIELELDFSDEDVAFADRKEFLLLIDEIEEKVRRLINSFQTGNVIKNGVSVAIIGKPNAGKSTLLNALINEERAIVSPIAGTTRDTIEETLNINGVAFRLIDTAGIREHSTDSIENIGIERSKHNASIADIILHLIEMTDDLDTEMPWLDEYKDKVIEVRTKYDQWQKSLESQGTIIDIDSISNPISATTGFGIEALKDVIYNRVMYGHINTEASIVTNARHHEALVQVMESLDAIKSGLHQSISGDLIAIDIRRALYYLGTITGQVEVDRDILGTIFGKFCIGK